VSASPRRADHAIAAVAPFAFALLWASSYIGAKVGLRDITPYLFVAVRLTIAATVALALLRLIAPDWQAVRRRWPHLLISGALVHGLALTTAHDALVTFAATPVALVHAFHPTVTAVFSVVLLGEQFRWWQWLGVVLGLCGVLLGIPPTIEPDIALVLLLSLIGLSCGTLYYKRFCADVRPFEGTAVQLVGGALLSVVATAVLEHPHWNWTPGLAGAMLWNTLLMSIFGMALYNAMLERHGAGRAASGFFIVPGAAALMAWALLAEHLSPATLIGLAAATLGVVLVWWRPRAAPGA
jgi:drug/metabolite transporter (DMT)-like permease